MISARSKHYHLGIILPVIYPQYLPASNLQTAVGKHELELLIDRDFDGVALEEWTPPLLPAKKATGGNGWIIWLLIIAAIIFFLSR
ncbi:MAG: hypothetical protein JW384_01119 [Nitrosomonadaceae bacterium]|nr:hypothetical protein [Nitrosomonadaceae bacterium]